MFKSSKYKAKRTERYGIKFDSISEADFMDVLLRDYSFKEIDLQPKIYLTAARILYKPDFKIIENGKDIYIDVKGMQTAVFRIKLRLWKAYIKDELRIVKRSGKTFKVTEVVNG